MTHIECYSSTATLSFCLYRHDIVSDLRVLIESYRYQALDDDSIYYAVNAWVNEDDEERRKVIHFQCGHISAWNTTKVTTMKRLFQDR